MVKVIAALVLALLFVLPAGAQDEPQNALNYCASTLIYDLPEGWVVGQIAHANYGTYMLLGTSAEVLQKSDFSTYTSDDAIINIEIYNRLNLAGILGRNAEEELDSLFRRLISRNPLGRILTEITDLTIRDRNAVQAEFTLTDEIVAYMSLMEIDEDSLALLRVTSKETSLSQSKAILLDVARSIQFNAPRFTHLDDSLPLTQSYANSDCTITLAYPNEWEFKLFPPTGNQRLHATISNFPNTDYQYMNGTLNPDRIILDFVIENHPEGHYGLSGLRTYFDSSVATPGTEIHRSLTTSINGKLALIIEADIETEQFEGSAITIIMLYGDNASATLNFYIAPGEIDLWRETTIAIAQSFQVNLPSS